MFLKKKKKTNPDLNKNSELSSPTYQPRVSEMRTLSDDGDDGVQGQDDAVVDSDVEEEEWIVVEEVEERLGNEDGNEDNHGDRC